MNRLLQSMFVVAWMVSLAACGNDEALRRQLMRDKYPSYPEEIRKAIDQGSVLKGMTQEQVLLSVGRSPCVDTRILGGKTFDSWSYVKSPSSGKLEPPSRCGGLPLQPVVFQEGYVIDGETK